MACANCGNDGCLGCTSSLPHCAGDPWDPADSKYDLEHPRQPFPFPSSAPEKPPAPRERWSQPCPRCRGVVEVAGRDTLPGPLNSEFPLTDVIDLACRDCAHAWQIEE